MPLEQHVFRQAPFYPDRCDVLTLTDGRRRRCCKPKREHAELPAVPERGTWDWCGKKEDLAPAFVPKFRKGQRLRVINIDGATPACVLTPGSVWVATEDSFRIGSQEEVRVSVDGCGTGMGWLARRFDTVPPRVPPTHSWLPEICNACSKPLLIMNLYVDDGCPCNSPRGVNLKPMPCSLCRTDCCVRPGHRLADLFGDAAAVDGQAPPEIHPAERRERCNRCIGTGQISDMRTASIRTDTVPPQIPCPDCSEPLSDDEFRNTFGVPAFGTPGCAAPSQDGPCGAAEDAIRELHGG